MRFWSPILEAHQLPPIGTEESDTLDFKDEPWGSSDGEKNELARDVAQFANNLGGTIVVGACEDGQNRLTEYLPVKDAAKVAQRVVDVCYGSLSPRFELDSRAIKDKDGRELVVINVPPADGVIAVKMTGVDRWEFKRRIGKGKKDISFEEVERMWTDGRRGQVVFSRIPDQQLPHIWLDVVQGQGTFINQEVLTVPERDHFLLEFGGNRFNVPYEYVLATYARAGGGWVLSLSVRFDVIQGQWRMSYASR